MSPVAAVRRLGRTSVVGVLAAGLLTGTALASGGSSAAGAVRPVGEGTPPVVSPTQELAMLLNAHRVSTTLPAGVSWATTMRASRPVTGSQTVVPVIGRAVGADGVQWLRVLIPGRPNGMKGWIVERGTVSTTTSWHVVVRTSSRRVLVYRHGRLARSFAAIVGRPTTPTPHGRFFVEESVLMRPGSAGAPFALALSARSEVLQRFEGGRGQIALHGVANLDGMLGTASSHGCVRLTGPSIRWLADHIAPGTPVTITA